MAMAMLLEEVMTQVGFGLLFRQVRGLVIPAPYAVVEQRTKLVPSNTIRCLSQQTLQWSWSPPSSAPPKPSLPSSCALPCSPTCSWQISFFLCSPMLSRSALGWRRRTCRAGTLFCWPRLAELRCLDRVRCTFVPGAVLSCVKRRLSAFDLDH